MSFRLGRHIEHDERSKGHVFHVAAQKPKTVLWAHNAPVLDQGQLGSCTGNAVTQWCNTDFAQKVKPGVLGESVAVAIYSLATTLDSIPGSYPPDDTGSSGLAVCKAAVKLGHLDSYKHSFGFASLLLTLQHTPVIVGTAWTKDMFTPDANGFIAPTGDVEGGHEYLILGCDVAGRYITMLNSWSSSWGENGRAKIRFSDFEELLIAKGDVTVPVI